MNNATKTAIVVNAIVRAAGAAPSHPLANGGGYAGDFAIHGTPETHTSPAGVLRALAALGISRGPWGGLTAGGFRVAALFDADGEQRGQVVYSPTGASATVANGLSRPLACFAS